MSASVNMSATPSRSPPPSHLSNREPVYITPPCISARGARYLLTKRIASAWSCRSRQGVSLNSRALMVSRIAGKPAADETGRTRARGSCYSPSVSLGAIPTA